MRLKVHSWGEPGPDVVACIHGVGHHGGVFGALAERLAASGRHVLAVDLRGHGDSGREPPWNVGTHVGDVLDTLEARGVERMSLIGHSFGGLVAATLAAEAVDRVGRLALLDPGIEISPGRALHGAEIDRLDWSFATIDGAINALMSSEMVVRSPRETVAEFAQGDVRRGADGRFRFRACPSTAVVAWSEMVLPAPAIAPLPTLVVRAEDSPVDGDAQQARYEDALGDLLTVLAVPNGHNVLWESPVETIEAVEKFLI